MACRSPRSSVTLTDSRSTPQDWFDQLHARFRFTVDAAASKENAKLPRYWTVQDSAFDQEWWGERIYINPPFSNIEPWVMKAHEVSLMTPLVVMVVPANRTEQPWWQTWIEPYRDNGGRLRTEFVAKRVKFVHPEGKQDSAPPFGVVLLIWGR